MQPPPYHYFPLTAPFLFTLAALATIVIALFELHLLAYVYQKMGISRRYVFGVLLLSLLGSYINIPLAELPAEKIETSQVVSFFGMDYVVPVVEESPGTIIAINVGGAVIPILLSLYLGARNRLFVNGLLGVTIVAGVTHALAYPVRGLGIAMPTFVPPVIAALVGFFLSRDNKPALAYISGSLGTLIGADLLNLHQIRGLGAPVASIGGAGTFDGIFLTGILAVLLTGGSSRTPVVEDERR